MADEGPYRKSQAPINLLSALPQPETGEVFEDLLRLGSVRIERIVSSATPEPVLYDQPQDEWVLLLQGNARLWIDCEVVALGAGDCILIPARTPHRVVSTSAQPPCVWLAVHINQPCPGADRAHAGSKQAGGTGENDGDQYR